MTPVNRSGLSGVYVWSQIQYLDPDQQAFKKYGSAITTGKKRARKRLLVALFSLVTLAGTLAVKYSHIVARIMN